MQANASEFGEPDFSKCMCVLALINEQIISSGLPKLTEAQCLFFLIVSFCGELGLTAGSSASPSSRALGPASVSSCLRSLPHQTLRLRASSSTSVRGRLDALQLPSRCLSVVMLRGHAPGFTGRGCRLSPRPCVGGRGSSVCPGGPVPLSLALSFCSAGTRPTRASCPHSPDACFALGHICASLWLLFCPCTGHPLDRSLSSLACELFLSSSPRRQRELVGIRHPDSSLCSFRRGALGRSVSHCAESPSLESGHNKTDLSGWLQEE